MPISALDDLLARFAPDPLMEESDRQRAVRGGAFGLAQHWQLVLPDGKYKELAIETLAEAAKLACAACP